MQWGKLITGSAQIIVQDWICLRTSSGLLPVEQYAFYTLANTIGTMTLLADGISTESHGPRWKVLWQNKRKNSCFSDRFRFKTKEFAIF
jgi:hypothetical protein